MVAKVNTQCSKGIGSDAEEEKFSGEKWDLTLPFTESAVKISWTDREE